MVVVRIIVKIVLLPVRICLTMIQLVVMFFTWLSATVFHILSGIICITAVLGYGFGQETGTEAVRMLVAGFVEYATYGMDSNLFVSKYELYLPNRNELQKLVNNILEKDTEKKEE